MAERIALAGRVRELELVTHHLMGQSNLAALLVVGEAGVGKSRLVTAAANRVADEDVLVLPGWCLAMSEGLPLLPVSEMLHALERAEGGTLLALALRACAKFVRGELVRLLPALGEDESEEARTETSARGFDEGWRRLRLFDALRQLLGAVASRRSIAAVIEDVHWADPSSLEFLDFLLSPARAADAIPVVLTCRSEETTFPGGGALVRASRTQSEARTSRPRPVEPGGDRGADQPASHLRWRVGGC
jgi:predicted ATPase